MSLLDLVGLRNDTLDRPPKPRKPTPQNPAAAGRKGGGAAATHAVTRAAPPPATWEPVAVVIYTETWRCICGASGCGTPLLMLQEHVRRYGHTRLRAIGHPLHYSNLPREVRVAEPSIIKACPNCVAETIRHPQLTLPGVDDPKGIPYRRTPLEILHDQYEPLRDEILRRKAGGAFLVKL